MDRFRLRLLVGVFVAVVGSGSAAAQTIKITPLAREGHVLVSFRLADALNDQVRAAIESGMNITFMYEVELRRSTALWVDRTMDEAVVSVSVRYDTLTRQYSVREMHDGGTVDSRILDSYEDVRKRLTEFEKLPLFKSSTLERNAEYYVRVRAHTMPRNDSFVWPWKQHDVMGQVKFTFLPH